jgi:glycosyltransferase involved in cell wall biosynthesis
VARILMAAYTNYRRDARVRREAEALASEGHDVLVIARQQPGEPSREAIEGVTVRKLRGVPNGRISAVVYAIDYGLFFLGLFAHLLAHPLRYRLIHINNMPDFLVFATVVPRMLGRPVIHDVHDLMPELYVEKFGAHARRWVISMLELQERWAGRFASAVLTVEQRLVDVLARRGMPRQKIHVLMNLPDDRIFRDRPPRDAPPVAGRLVVVYHGTLARRLGLDIAIEAVGLARATIPGIELRIIGAGEARPELVMLRDRMGLADAVTFSEGFVPLESIPALLQDADVGVVPLRVADATALMLPTKLLEYVTMGIPCIVPRTETINRYFDASMVRFFDAEDPASLAEAMIDLFRHPEMGASLAQHASERFGRIYRWSSHKAVYTHLVDRLLGAKERQA